MPHRASGSTGGYQAPDPEEQSETQLLRVLEPIGVSFSLIVAILNSKASLTAGGEQGTSKV